MNREPREKRQKKRRAYEKPRILSREKLEVIAVACSPGKAPGDLTRDCTNFANS